jgi:hypothetical protein
MSKKLINDIDNNDDNCEIIEKKINRSIKNKQINIEKDKQINNIDNIDNDDNYEIIDKKINRPKKNKQINNEINNEIIKQIDLITNKTENINLNKIHNDFNNNKISIPIYPNEKKLINICESFQNQIIKLEATFMGKTIEFCDCNIVGNVIQCLFFNNIKEKINDFEEGPKQLSPDYYGMNKEYEFENKAFFKNPGFDIANFKSYISQLCEDNGVYRKIFKTKYLIFEYSINDDKHIVIEKFHYLNVFNLVSYEGKYPISIQVKKDVWYNIRPDSVKNWYKPDKTPNKFIDKIIQSIKICPNMKDTEKKIYIDNINKQFENIKLKYTF